MKIFDSIPNENSQEQNENDKILRPGIILGIIGIIAQFPIFGISFGLILANGVFFMYALGINGGIALLFGLLCLLFYYLEYNDLSIKNREKIKKSGLFLGIFLIIEGCVFGSVGLLSYYWNR